MRRKFKYDFKWNKIVNDDDIEINLTRDVCFVREVTDEFSAVAYAFEWMRMKRKRDDVDFIYARVVEVFEIEEYDIIQETDNILLWIAKEV